MQSDSERRRRSAGDGAPGPGRVLTTPGPQAGIITGVLAFMRTAVRLEALPPEAPSEIRLVAQHLVDLDLLHATSRDPARQQPRRGQDGNGRGIHSRIPG